MKPPKCDLDLHLANPPNVRTKFMLFISNEFCDFWITRVRDSKLTTASQQQVSKRCLRKESEQILQVHF